MLELAVWLGLPAWIANATPVIFGGGRPIDGGRCFRDGRRLLGDGKTIRGFFVGVFFGILTGVGQSIAAPHLHPLLAQFVEVTPEMQYVLFMTFPSVVLLSVGALFGDIFGSFLKRRVNLESGAPSPLLDQLGFIIMGLLFAYPVLQPEPAFVVILIFITLAIHWISNALGYLLGFKKNPW
ncbi:CDP-2,3-bis-(O-geranylgeranyl)-sn-glycerol synthase [Candidatus Thorarchaeota archaeon]|nr:MAG: CDP-2,3-bis-(O-geranylgeranyl)-sn-glycerol synthase [Candidatus Thorarchaeota archaeon]